MSERVRVHRICEITGLGKRQVQAMAAKGQIPSAAQLGKLWTFDETRVRRWIQSRERQAWPKTSTGAVRHGGVVFRLPGRNIEEAYARAIGLKPSSGSKSGARKSGAQNSTAPTG